MKDRYAVVFLIFIGLFFYSLTLKGVLGNPGPNDFKGGLDQAAKPLELSPERGRFANVLALAEFHTYDLGQKLADAVYPDAGVYQNKYFSLFAPGVAYLALPFYLLGRYFNLSLVGTFSLVALMSVVNLFLLFIIARRTFGLPGWAGVLAALIFGFATTSWSYAVTLYQHQFTVFFILSSFYAVWKYKQRGKYSWGWGLWVWFAYGLAITVDYPNALLMLPVVLYLAITSIRLVKYKDEMKFFIRPALLVGAFALFAVLGWNAYHNQNNFGSWKKLSGELPDYQSVLELNSSVQPNSEVAVRQLGEKKGMQNFFQETNVPFSFYTLTVSPDRGLLVYAPIMLLGILGIFAIRKKVNLEAVILLSVAFANLLLYSSWGDPWGGWAYGPRYLIPTMAVLALFSVLWLDSLKRSLGGKIAVLLLFAYSSAVALLGVLTTNSVPPKIEADVLHSRYNFLYNLDFLQNNQSSSFFYNTFFSHYLTLSEYFFVIYVSLISIVMAVLFILPKFGHDAEKNSLLD